MLKITLLAVLFSLTVPLLAQRVEVLTLTGSYSASNGGFIFSSIKGDTTFVCPNHPDSCLEKKNWVSMYPQDSGGPDLDPRFSNKKFRVTYTITDSTLTNDDGGPRVTATVTKMEFIK